MKEQVTERLLNVADDAEAVTQAYKLVLIEDETADIDLPDGTKTPSLNKRIKQFGGQVTSVNGEKGEIVIDGNSLGLGSASKYNVIDLPISAAQGAINDNQEDINNKNNRTFSSVQELLSCHKKFLLNGSLYTVGTSRGGLFKWVVGSGKLVNNGTVFLHDSEKAGKFERQYTGVVYAEWFGAENFIKGGKQDSTLAFQACADFCGIGGAWKFKGLHRITNNIFIPARQSFGGDRGLYSPYRHITSDPVEWTGVNTGTMQTGDAIFYDNLVGDAITMGEGARPHDFLIYGKGVTVLGVNTTVGLPAASWSGNTSAAFRYGKFILPTNITIAYFKYAYSSRLSPVSNGGVNVSGNYYQKMTSNEIVSCYCAFQFLDAIVYNHKCYDLKISSTAKIFESSVELRNIVFFGGSVEGYTEGSSLPNSSDIAFIGTYFETFSKNLVSTVFLLGDNCTISITDCLIYLNNCNHFVRDYTQSVTASRIISKGNKFRAGSSNVAPRNYIFKINMSPSVFGSLSSDAITYAAGSDVVYIESSNTSLVKDAPMILIT